LASMERSIVERIAKVARIDLSEKEIDEFKNDLEDILEYFEMLDNAPSEGSFGFNPVEIADVLREDVPSQEIEPKELLKGMRTYDGYIRGPRLS